MLRSTTCLLLALGLTLPAAAAPRSSRRQRAPVRAVLPEAVSGALLEGNLGGDFRLLERLLAAAPPNAVNRSGQSALFFAANSGRVDLVRALLDRGANPNHLTPYGSSVFNLLNFYQPGTPAIVRLLLERGIRVELRQPGDSTPLMLVADSGNLPAVRMLLARGANPNAVNKDGETPLYCAARTDGTEAVSALLAAGAKINHRTKEGDTALGRAALCGNSGVFRLLLKRGADPRLKDQSGHSLLYAAIVGGSPSILRTTLKLGLSPRERYPDGGTPLQAAVETDNAEIVTMLLKAGADPNVADEEGVTPLMYVSGKGSVELVALLLEHKANVHAKAKDGSTAISHAKSAGELSRDPEVVALLKKAGAVAPDVDLVTAVKNNDLEGVQGALARGESADRQVEAPSNLLSGMLDMFRAAGRREDPKKALDGALNLEKVRKVPLASLAITPLGSGTEVFEALLQAGADPSGTDTEGNTLLMTAASMGRVDVAQLLLAKGARLDARNTEGNDALLTAIQGGGIDIIRLLLEKGADPNTRTQKGLSPLHLSIATFGLQERVSPELISLLVEKGADVNAADAEGLTPLMLAAMMPPPESAFEPPAADADPATQLTQAMRQTTRKLIDQARKAAAERAAKEGAAPSQPAAPEPANPDDKIGGLFEKLSKALLAPVWDKRELIRFLIACGADPNRRVEQGFDALMMGFMSSQERHKPDGPTFRALIEGGANVNGTAPKLPSVLAMAASAGNTAAMNALLALKADPNLKLHEGWTALHVAIASDQTEAAGLLIRKGANVNTRTDEGITPLMQAVEEGNTAVVSLLLKQRADLTAVGPKGMTALGLARASRNRPLESLLKKAGAK